MGLHDAIKKAVIESLQQVNILMLGNYARQYQHVLDFLLDNGIIDNASIERALEGAVFRQARQDYEFMTTKRGESTPSADHLLRPEILAYALVKGRFSKEEIKKMPFDHGETAETFIREYRTNDLPARLREELLNPQPPTESGMAYEVEECFEPWH